MSDLIPLDLMTQILKRVPPKSLIQFRCVSKSWNSLISSPDFVSLHTQHAFQSENPEPRILVRHFSADQNAEFYSAHHDNEAFTVHEDVKIVIPLCDQGDTYFRVAGSSNGLVFLSDDLLGYRESFVLLNPSLRRKITLPLPRAIFKNVGPYDGVVGFGYDAKSNDFKVVKITYLQGGYDMLDAYLLPPIVEVFSLSTRKWREIDGNSIRTFMRGQFFPHAFLNGRVHWIASEESDGKWIRNLILVFDISDEVFVEMPLPTALIKDTSWLIGIAVYEESLVVFGDDDIWVMEEYGVEKSWAKMINISVQGLSNRRILGFRKNGSILLAREMASGRAQLVSYDPKTQHVTELGVFGSCTVINSDLAAVTYTECLALQNEGEQALAALPNEIPLFIQPEESDSLDEERHEENN